MKILIVKTSSFGDIVQAFPVVQFLEQTINPDQIDWVVENRCSELVKAHPLINKVIELDIKKWKKSFFKAATYYEMKEFFQDLREVKYDLVIDLQGNTKSAIPTFFARANQKIGFGPKTVAEWPNMLATYQRFDPPIGQNIREDYLYLVEQFFHEKIEMTEKISLKITAQEQLFLDKLQKDKFNVLVCPGSVWPNKQLEIGALKAMLTKLQQEKDCLYYFSWGNEEEKKLALELVGSFEKAHLLDKVSLPLLQNVMASMDLVIAMDSLPLHLAATTNTKTFSVFGSSSMLKYKPMGKNHQAIQGSCPYGQTFEKRCPELRTCPTGACIKDLKVEDLWPNLKSLIS